MAFWDALRSEQGTGWNPTPGYGQRNDYSIPLKVGTAIEAPVSGIVLPQSTAGKGLYSYYGRQRWGGEVDILTSMPDYPGPLQVVNVLHFDTLKVKPGDQVIEGQTILGTSGGQNSGGNMPSSPIDSTGPHIGIGVHSVPSWDAMYNPVTLINNLLAGRNVSAIPAQSQLQGAGLGWLPRGGVPSATGIPLAAGTWPGVPNQIPPGKPSPPSDNPLCNVPLIGGVLCALLPQIDWWVPVKLIGGVLLLLFGGALFIISTIGPDIGAAAITAAGIPEAAPVVKETMQRHKATGIFRSGIRAKGAIEGRKTLQRRELEGKLAEAQAQHEQRQAWGRMGAQAAKAAKARRQQTIPGEDVTERKTATPEEAKRLAEIEERNQRRKELLGQYTDTELAAMSPEERAKLLRAETRKNLGE